MIPEKESNLELDLGPELKAGLDRLYGYAPRPKPESNPILQIQINERRGQIADGIHKTINKLGFNHPDRLNLPVEERPNITYVIRENLLGFIGDDVLISDLIPQNENLDDRRIKIKNDPLWQHISPLLTPRETGVVATALSSLRNCYLQMQNGKVNRQSGINASIWEHENPKKDATFETVGDLRKISLRGWNSMNGFGPTTAKLMFEAIKKIDIPADKK